jgi:SAM-dependent methyltransferase
MAGRFRKALTLFDDYYEMMSDRVRTGAYERAIEQLVQPGDIVVDLGAGLGILTLLALRAGAAKVYAIEKSDSIELMRKVVDANGLSERVVFLAESSRDVTLDERADVLLSETLGSFGVEENTVEFTIDARDRLLKPDGRLLPSALELFLCPVELPEEHEKVAFWADVHGFDFTAAQSEHVSRMSLAGVKERALLGAPQRYASIDLATVDDGTLEGRQVFPITRKGTIHGLAGWFRATLAPDVVIDTAPSAPPTHWRQAFFPFRDPVDVIRGDHLEVTLSVRPEGERSDNTSISYDFRCTQLANERAAAAPTSAKVGRNDPCPCGSGKKYKRCCGA